METIISALIAASATLGVCLLNNNHQLKRLEAQLKQQREEAEAQRELQLKEADRKHEETINLIVYRLDQLEKKQDKYNGVIERTYELEKKEEVLEAELEATNKEVKRLGHFHE